MMSYEDSILMAFEALSTFSDDYKISTDRRMKIYKGEIDVEGLDGKLNWSSALYIEPRHLFGRTYRGFKFATDVWKWASASADMEFDKPERTADVVMSSLDDVCLAQKDLRRFLDDERERLEATIRPLSGPEELPISVYGHEMRLIYQPSGSMGDVVRFKYEKNTETSSKAPFVAYSLVTTIDKLVPLLNFQIERLTEALESIKT